MTFPEWKILVVEIARALTRDQNNLLLLGAKDLEGRMKQRIFNKGKNSDDLPIGPYKSKWWIKQRKKGGKYSPGGRQTKYVDLENTSELRNSIQVVKDPPGVALAVINDFNFDKAMGQQIIQGKKKGLDKMLIFEPTAKEIKGVQNYINDLIDEKIDDILRKYKS